MRAEFSEFTYGFSLVSELARVLNCTAAPIFPSLIAEGQPGGGYDVAMDVAAVPFFLQFKLSEHLKTNGAKEAKHPSGLISAPYRRFHITNPIKSTQHASLLGLAATTEHVYYCAPDFYQTGDLNFLWSNGGVAQGSVFINPTDIGQIIDDERHAVCFNGTTLRNRECILFSEPSPLKHFGIGHIGGTIAAALSEAKIPLRDLLATWEEDLNEAQQAVREIQSEQEEKIRLLIEERRRAERKDDGIEQADRLPGFSIQMSYEIAEPDALRSRMPARSRVWTH